MYQQANVLVKLGYLGKVLKLLNENTVHFLIAAEDSAVKGRRYKKKIWSVELYFQIRQMFSLL